MNPSVLDEQTSPEFVYVDGLNNNGSFAWPVQAPEGLALALVGTEGTEVPEAWKSGLLPHVAKCAKQFNKREFAHERTLNHMTHYPHLSMQLVGTITVQLVEAKTACQYTTW